MCSTCGCSQPSDAVTVQLVGLKNKDAIIKAGASPRAMQASSHHHDHHHHSPAQTQDEKLIQLELDILGENNRLAERNRGYFEAKNILALNLVSSPGSGKTSLLERSLRELATQKPCSVIEGDQQTANDAERIAATGVPVVQINTGKGCHLDAAMINRALKELNPADNSLLFIENVGNLVCPAMFDLGEALRVVIISVTEGDDKPLKYPDIFHSAQLVVINKIDLLPYVPFDVEKLKDNVRKVSHNPEFICLSAYTGEGISQWYDWLLTPSQEAGLATKTPLYVSGHPG